MLILSFDVGLKNLAYCVYNTETNKIEKWSVDNVEMQKGDDVCRAIVKYLDKLQLTVNQWDTLLIEKQPVRNNKMRIVENLLNVYYIIKNPERKIIVYSPKHKLGSDTFKGAKMYRERKKLGVNRCYQFLNDTHSTWKEIFEKSKKKDDLADCLLQALSYCNRCPTGNVENNICKVVARKPTPKQERSGYSKSNIKYLILQNKINMEHNSKFYKSFIKFFKSLDDAYNQLDINANELNA